MKNASMLDAIMERASVREFDREKRVSEKVAKQILLAGSSAPSAGNIQPRTFIVVQDENVKEQLYELCEEQAFMKDAPLWIVVCADIHRHLRAAELTGVDYDYTGILPFTFGVLDAALSLENMVIAAEALGLGSVIVGSVIEHPEKAKRILKLPSHCLALSILCVGYPKERPSTREKWSRDVIVCKDEYKDVDTDEVLDYWARFILSDLKRLGKRASLRRVRKSIEEGKQVSYGRAYANHYKEDFVHNTNRKLTEFLESQSFLRK
jgi:nitroreductase